jgi:hypothetical protein
MKDSIDSSFLKLFLSNISDPETGDFKPSHRGYISNFKKDAKNQSIDVQIKTSVWMQFKYLEPLFTKKMERFCYQEFIKKENLLKETLTAIAQILII